MRPTAIGNLLQLVLLFIMYIKSMPDCFFADDTKFFRSITGDDDQRLLQENGIALRLLYQQRAVKWDWSTILTLMKNKLALNYRYKPTLEPQITSEATNANTIFAVIEKTFHKVIQQTFLQLYKALFRPHLE